MNESECRPWPGESLGEYLKRLRSAAAEAQGHPVTLEEVAGLTEGLSTSQRFTPAWLSVAEKDGYQQPGEHKLRTLASIYSRLLRNDIAPEWLLSLAGYEIRPPINIEPKQETLDRLLRYEDILALVAAAGQLIEMGHAEDVRLLVAMAHRYINAHDPERRIGDIFDDPMLSAHVENFMRKMKLL